MLRHLHIMFFLLVLSSGFLFNSAEIKAADTRPAKINNNLLLKKASSVNMPPHKKSFIKRFFIKTGELIKKTTQKISRRIKRIFSKRKAKKERMKSPFRKRHRNLFNILMFLSVFGLLTGLLLFLYLSETISSAVFTVLMIVAGITAIVIALIYFSKRYILKPHYKS